MPSVTKVITGVLALALPGTALAQAELAPAAQPVQITIAAGDAIELTADNEFDLYVDGFFIGSGNNWPVGATFSLNLAAGPHVMAVRTRNAEDFYYGGWIADLTLGNGQHVITDGSWRWTTTPPSDWTLLSADHSSWSMAQVKGPFGISPWGQQPQILAGTSAYWIGSRADTYEPGGDFFYRKLFSVAGECPVGVPLDPTQPCTCPEGTTLTGAQSRSGPPPSCEPIAEEDGDPTAYEADPQLCLAQAQICACLATSSRIQLAGCTCPDGATLSGDRCACGRADGCTTCPSGQVYNPNTGFCDCGATSDPNGCDASLPVDDCPPNTLCPDTYTSTFEPFLLYGGHGVHQCGTPQGTYRPASSGWVAVTNTNFTAIHLGSGGGTSDDYLSDPSFGTAAYEMLLQRHYGDPAQLVDYHIDFSQYNYQGGTRSLTITSPAPEENPPAIAGTTFRAPDGTTPATVDHRVDLLQTDLVSVRYNVSIQDLPYDRISGLRFRATTPGITAGFVSGTRINGNVPGGVDPATVAGHVYTTNAAHQEKVVGELLLPRGHLYTIDSAYVEFMDLLGVRLNEVKVKRPLSVVTDSAGAEDPSTNPESFTIDLRSFAGCQVDVYIKISKPAGRILGDMFLEPAPSMPPAVGPRVIYYSPSYLGYRVNNALDGERLGYYVNGAPKYLTPVAGRSSYDYKCIPYDRWLPTHRANSVTAYLGWPAGFGAGNGWLRWPVHGRTAMNPIDAGDALTTGLDRDGFVYLDGPSTILQPDGTPYWPNTDPTTTDGPGLIYPAPIGPLQLFTESINFDTRMAYLNGHVDLAGCIETNSIVSGHTIIVGLPDGTRGSFRDERGFLRYEVNGAQRGEALGIFRGALANRGDYQVVGANGPWQEQYYHLNLRRGSNPDDWQNYYNGELVVNTAPRRTYPLVGHDTLTAADRDYETGLVRIRMRVRNAPFSFDASGNAIPNPEFRPFRNPHAYIGSGAVPTWPYTDSTGQTGKYYSHSAGSGTVKTTHYLTIVGVANSVVNIGLLAVVPTNPDGTGRFLTSGFPPLLRVPIRAGETCVDVCTDPAGNQVPCNSNCDPAAQDPGCPASDACHTSWCDGVTRQCTSSPIDCTDSDPCTVDGCNPAIGCTHAPDTSNPSCGSSESPCPQGCEDNNPCTVDTCELTGCQHDPVADGTACDDGSACTRRDSCQAGFCAGDDRVVCTAADQCHDAGTCDPGSGRCSNPIKANGSACSDGNACTQTDTCQEGACSGANPVVCAASDQCHVAGTCDPANGQCSNPAAVDGTACSDGDGCTRTDTCQAGACHGADPVVCAASDQCHVAGTCDPASGACSNPAKPDGASCTDGNACTQSDSCQAGACTGANPVICTASDQCHDAGTCDAASGLCSNPPKADGSACSDGSACTQTDTCQAGACTGANPVICTASDQCHVAGVCDAATGSCSNPAAADGTPCSDGNACTRTDACQAGACAGSSPVVCTASDQCHVAGTCDPASGSCSNPAKPDGTACNDTNACTTGDVCTAGACAGDPDTDDDGIGNCTDPCPVDHCNLCDERMNLKPFSNPSAMDIGGTHALPVSIMGSADLDVTQLNLGSLSFDIYDPDNTASIKARGRDQLQINYWDIDGDGFIDAEIHFISDASALACIGAGLLTGEMLPTSGCGSFTASHVPIHGERSDPIKVLNATASCTP